MIRRVFTDHAVTHTRLKHGGTGVARGNHFTCIVPGDFCSWPVFKARLLEPTWKHAKRHHTELCNSHDTLCYNATNDNVLYVFLDLYRPHVSHIEIRVSISIA